MTPTSTMCCYTRNCSDCSDLTHIKSNQISRRCKIRVLTHLPELPTRRPAIGNAKARVTTHIKMPILFSRHVSARATYDLAMEIPALETMPPIAALPDIPSYTGVHSAAPITERRRRGSSTDSSTDSSRDHFSSGYTRRPLAGVWRRDGDGGGDDGTKTR